MGGLSSLTWMMILWGAVTAVFAGLIIYRSLISMKEDDQLFLDPAKSTLAEEQNQIITRVERITPYTKGFGFASAALLLAMAGVWLYQGLVSFSR